MPSGKVIGRGGTDLLEVPRSGTPVKTLRRGSVLEVLAEETWLRVRASDGSTGFVRADRVERVPAFVQGTPPAPAAPSDACVIETYHHDRFTGNEILADLDFFPVLDRIAELAESAGVRLHVTSSFRDPDRRPDGAIVPPATRSNHFVGHAIDMNLVSPSGFFNSGKLRRAALPGQPAEIRGFVELVRAEPGLRWGGDFSPEDPVHIDDGLNRADPARWEAKLASLAD